MDLASNRSWLLIYMMYLSFKTWGLSGPRTAYKSVARHNPHTDVEPDLIMDWVH